MSGKGFHVSPPSMHEHASRVEQRGDQVSSSSGRASGGGLSGGALGMVGEAVTGGSQRLAGTVSRVLGTAGTRLQSHGSLIHNQADGFTSTDTEHASTIRAIHPSAPSSGTRPTSGSGSSRPAGAGGRPPVPPKPPNLRPAPGGPNRPNEQPSWMGTDANGWPTTTGRPRPTVFNPSTNNGENYQSRVDANGNQWVTVHRFASDNGGSNQMWQSPERFNGGGDHPVGGPGTVNNQANYQTHFGRNSDSSVANPFVSVTTDPNALAQHGEPWAQAVVNNSTHLGTFEVPASSLYRPSIVSATTRNEQEWLFHDGQAPLGNYGNVVPNPHRTS